MPDPMNPDPLFPGTIEEVIEKLLYEMSLKEKTRIANMDESDLLYLYPTLGSYIRNRFLWKENKPLIQDCMNRSGRDDIDGDEASAVIINALWEHLKTTHRLRIVK
ncbi:MAG: hypothetical protein PVG39_30910 [Desulfobacteraceae bacterium]